MTPSGSAPNAASPRPLGRSTSSAPGATVVDVEVDVVDVDVDVEVEVEVDAAVVTGVVVLVVDNGADDELAPETDEDVEPESVDAGSSLLHATIVSATRNRGTRRSDFTVGSLARFVAIT